ncbi:reverse transcriptase domain, reverse transcriptase zinc-binding domain protein, partial [Tanacetum coccineum]
MGIQNLLFKVDFKKAFDSVNWAFLKDIMCKMGFGVKWCNWIHGCLSSALVSIFVNGSPTNEFFMERGLRQGDPLSPFLFIIMVEALQVLFLEACSKGIYNGIYLCNEGPNISLLQYADDALIFGVWSRRNVKNLVSILSCFEDMSSLKVNLSKSSLFGVGANFNTVNNMAYFINRKADRTPFTYLGLPVGKDKSTCRSWSEMVEKFTKRLSLWK